MASPTNLRPPQRIRSPQKDVFKPRFPIDPFASAKVREPWYIKTDQLPVHPRRDVYLLLGAPTIQELSPLLLSKHLCNSLLIIATHHSIEIPQDTLPTVRILSLKNRLDIEDAGAVRFVNVMEWAERVARIWRKHGGVGAATLSENDDGQDFVPPTPAFSLSGFSSTPASPRSSNSHLSMLSTPTPTGTRRRSSLFLGMSKSRPTLPAIDPSQRPFDGIINFLPKNTSDKALLKQSILVTTISRPFLMAAHGGRVRPPRSPSNKRRSIFGARSTISVYLPPTPPTGSGESLAQTLLPSPTKAHIVHLLPQESRAFNASARSKLVQGLESFLISFAYPTSLDMSSKNNFGDSLDRARPYLMQVGQLSQKISVPPVSPTNFPYQSEVGSYTLADLVLNGSLDGFDTPSVSANSKAKEPIASTSRLTPRAWISGPSDVVLLSDDNYTQTLTIDPPNVTFTPPTPDTAVPPSPTSASSISSSSSRPASPPGRPPRNARRPALTQAAADSSFSSVVSSTSTSSTSNSASTSASGSPVPSSPLAHEYSFSTRDGVDRSALSLKALPTPPDSDESGSDSNNADTQSNAHSVSVGNISANIKQGVTLGFGTRKRAVSGPSPVPDSASFKTKSSSAGTVKWKFWRIGR